MSATRTAVPAVEATGLTRHFGEVRAVDDLTFSIPQGGVVGVVGPNGSGKSTTIRMLLGLIRPTTGTAQVLGHDIAHPTTYADRVGALIENPAFVAGISARANLQAMASLRGVAERRVQEVLDIVGLTARADDRVATYSLGMKQRLGIAIALLSDPDLLMLDEPTNGLDPAGIVEIRTLIRRLADEGRTVLVSTHLLSEVEAIADHVLMIRFGRLVYVGTLGGLLEQAHADVLIEPARGADLSRLIRAIQHAGHDVVVEDTTTLAVAIPAEDAPALHSLAVEHEIRLRRLEPRAESLEALFIRLTDGADRPAHALR